jgi:hypothetical protein
MMQFTERHVLTVNEPSVVKKVLDAFSVGVQAQVWVSPETRRGLVQFSKQNFNRLILNLQVTKDLHATERLPGGRSSGPDRPGQPTLDAAA